MIRAIGISPTLLSLLVFSIGELGEICYAQPPCVISFVDKTTESGVDFRLENGASGQKYLLEMMSGGAVSFDADCDGLMDLYLVNGGELPGRKLTASASDRFFRNLGGFRFKDCTDHAGFLESQYGLGAAAADFNNDGFSDLYLSNFGTKTLLQNNGDGTFTDVTELAGVADGKQFGAGVTFLDVDLDGNLDLFVGNYVEFSIQRHKELAPKALPLAPEPVDYRSAKDSLFLSNGDGTFTDKTSSSGIGNVAGNSMSVLAADFDADGDVDIFVACDATPSLYYKNEGNCKFVEEGYVVGTAVDSFGSINGNMGVDVGDVDGNGLPDMIITNFAKQQVQLLQNVSPGGFFEDISSRTKVGKVVVPHVNWGVGLVDFDHDTDLDCFLCNGHLYVDAKKFDAATDYAVENCLMENLDRKTFRHANAAAGQALSDVACSRTALFDDFDNDGDVDVFVVNCDKRSQFLENRYSGDNHWIQIQLVGRQANRDALGAVVRIQTSEGENGMTLFRVNGRGYQSSFGSVLHTGTGTAKRIARIEVTWPGNPNPTILENVACNQRILCLEPHP